MIKRSNKKEISRGHIILLSTTASTTAPIVYSRGGRRSLHLFSSAREGEGGGNLGDKSLFGHSGGCNGVGGCNSNDDLCGSSTQAHQRHEEDTINYQG